MPSLTVYRVSTPYSPSVRPSNILLRSWSAHFKRVQEGRRLKTKKFYALADRIGDVTGWSKKTVTSNISLTDLKITKNSVTQSFLKILYPTIYASSTCLAVWATLGHFGPLWATMGHFWPLWATLGHFGPLWLFGPLWATLGHFGCLGHYGPLWATLFHLAAWATLGRFGCLGQFGPLWAKQPNRLKRHKWSGISFPKMTGLHHFL